MYEKIIETLARVSNDNMENTRRRFPRRMQDSCVAEIEGTAYPVRDWSQVGVLIEADGRGFEKDHDVTVTMKFRLSESVIEFPVLAKTVRTGKTQVAFEFHDLSPQTQMLFGRVIDDAIARSFADTQKA